MAVKLSPILNDQQFNSNGTLLSGGKIETFLAGSSTPATTFTTDAGTVAQSNPIILNTRGEVPNPIYLTTGVKYKLVLKDSVNNVLRTYDNIEGVNDSSSGIDQWLNTSVAPVFVNTTTFTLAGDQTNAFHVNRRVKLLVTAGTLYGFISASAFTTLTTVTVVLDSGVLDSGLSSVQIGLITPINSSIRIIQQQLASNVSGNGPAFRAVANVAQNVASGVFTIVTLGTEIFDTNNNFLNNQFTPTVAGYYQLDGVLRIGGTALTLAILSIYKNGLEDVRGDQVTNPTAGDQIGVSGLVFCNGTTDVIALFGVVTGTTPSYNFVSSNVTSMFMGSLVRAA